MISPAFRRVGQAKREAEQKHAEAQRAQNGAEAAKTKPTILLIPGAWHRAYTYALVIAVLTRAGYPCVTVDLPTCGSEPPLKDPQADNEAVRQKVEALVKEGKEVITVAHSYGCIVCSNGTKGLTKNELEAAGDSGPGGVIGIVYVAAALVPLGDYLGKILEAKGTDHLEQFEDGNVLIKDPVHAFFNDLAPQEALYWMSTLQPHSGSFWMNTLAHDAWRHTETTFILCKRDNAAPIRSEEQLKQTLNWTVDHFFELDAGHDPMLGQPEEVARIIRKAAGENVD